MEIVKLYKEALPPVRLIGNRYTNEHRDANGCFGRHWQRWFEEKRFDALAPCKAIPGVSEDYVGAMRFVDGAFEYWIGAIFASDSLVPDGFESIDVPAGELAVCWLYGDTAAGQLFSPEAVERCTTAMANEGWRIAQEGWFLERYNCPRFTAPDERGNVILDICAYTA